MLGELCGCLAQPSPENSPPSISVYCGQELCPERQHEAPARKTHPRKMHKTLFTVCPLEMASKMFAPKPEPPLACVWQGQTCQMLRLKCTDAQPTLLESSGQGTWWAEVRLKEPNAQMHTPLVENCVVCVCVCVSMNQAHLHPEHFFNFMFYRCGFLKTVVCLSTNRAPDVHGDQKRALDHLELEPQTVLSHRMIAGTILRFSARAVCILNQL